MISGNSTLSLRKNQQENGKTTAIGYQKMFFGHQATAGATGINLNSLTLPLQMAQNGLLNPTASQLAAANLLFFQNNLTLTSSARGVLQKNLSYVISSSTQISFLGFTALEGEIFSGTIDNVPQTGLKVVDATATPATGTLLAGTTDFNAGNPLQTNKYPTTQHGAYLIYKDGVLQYRNPNNSSSLLTGNYYEVDNGSGSSGLFRFNQATDQDVAVTAIPNGLLSERPDGSMMAVIETLQGQLNNLAPYVAVLAGLPVNTVLGGAPSNADLKAFGDRVLTLEQNRARIDLSNAWTAYQGIPGRTDGTAIASGLLGETVTATNTLISAITANYVSNATPFITLIPGTWIIFAYQNQNGAASLVNINSFISTNSASDSTGNIDATASQLVAGNTGGYVMPMIPIYYKNNASVSLFAKAQSTGASVSVSIRGYAVRIG